MSLGTRKGCCSLLARDGVPPIGEVAVDDGGEVVVNQNWCAMAHSSTLAGHEALFGGFSVLADSSNPAEREENAHRSDLCANPADH